MANQMSRRSILKSVVVFAGAGAASGALEGCGSSEKFNVDTKYFPQSVASGDPKEASVVLWTRVEDAAATGDLSLRLQVATDASFDNVKSDQSALKATAAHHNTLKVKVVGLSAGTTYYYRFLYTNAAGATVATRTGRTKTAPAAAADAPVKFALLNCQDYVGRYYNTIQHLLAQNLDLDFVLGLGDYIYETDGDPSFQISDPNRAIKFADAAGSISLDGGKFHAARSLDNYRQIYRTYKTDAQLQALHERYPFIMTWDDHEFSDDCWGDTSTYFDGAKPEKDTVRRLNAEQAFFEFMPIDDGSAGGAFTTETAQLYPNTKLWRAFTFGKNAELIMTDYRSFRPDHLIPEDGFPGEVVMDKATLTAVAGANVYASLPESIFAYVNIDDSQYSVPRSYLVAALSQGYAQAGMGSGPEASAKAAAVVKGNLALIVVNAVLAQAGVGPIDTAGKDKGLAWAQMGKQGLLTRLGSRYLTVKPMYDLYAAYKYATTAKASENAYGAAQEAYVKDRLANSPATFKVVASSTSLSSMLLDLRTQTQLPATLQQQFYLDCDQWDGFPDKRNELYGPTALASVHNAIFCCGDIHGGFVSKIAAGTGNDLPVITSPSISSQTIKEELFTQAAELGLGQAGKDLVAQLEAVLKASNPDIVFVQGDVQGFAVVEIAGTTAKGTMYMIPNTEVTVDYSKKPADLAAKFTAKAFTLSGGAVTAI
jgi:alkaline phosphatase D